MGRRGITGDRYYGRLVGPGLDGRRFDIHQGGNYHLEPTDEEVDCFPYAMPFGGKCYVGSSRTSLRQLDDGLRSSIADAKVVDVG